MIKDEYLELSQGLNRKKDLYYAEIERIKKRTNDLSDEINLLTNRYIESNSKHKIGDHVMFEYDGCLYYILKAFVTNNCKIVYSLTDKDIKKLSPAKEVGAIYIHSCDYINVQEDKLLNLSRETV